MIEGRLAVTMVNACLREGRGGSATAVLDAAAPLSDAERRRVPILTGASHAVFVSVDQSGGTGSEVPSVSMRFFTAEGELPACGHGTLAALAALAVRAGADEYRATVRAGKRVFAGWARREAGRLTAGFDPGPVSLREATAEERDAVHSVLGSNVDLVPGTSVASVGRERLLVPVATRGALDGLAPDSGRLREVCDRFGFLGCYVYNLPTPQGEVAARMFAPSIGVPEDVANANSAACLAARLAGQGAIELRVQMGESVGSPSEITASARFKPSGTRIELAGAASVGRVRSLRL